MKNVSFETPAFKSRIPVPLSPPMSLRRSTSFRDGASLQDSRLAGFDPGRRTTLRRGRSFMERGERGGTCNGVVGCTGAKGAKGPPCTSRHHQSSTPTSSSSRKGSNAEGVTTLGGRARNLSLSLSSTTRLSSPTGTSSPRTPPTSPLDYRSSKCQSADWDSDSITSGISGLSLASSCDHASVARNGTTFSGKTMKYVFHCSHHAGVAGEDYLTPTQRAQRQVRRLKSLLHQAHKDLDQKDSDIIKLTKEVVELRLCKAALSSPEERSNSSDAVTVRENQLDDDLAIPLNATNEIMTGSYTDSGHYDDYTNSSIHSKDSELLSENFAHSPFKRGRPETVDRCVSTDDLQYEELMAEYEKRIQELVKSHENESQDQRQKHNDKVEELLQRIAEINKRYWDLVPDLDNAKDRIKELESQLEDALRKLEEQDDKHKQVYLQMYAQGQEAAKVEREQQVMELAQQMPTRISVPELLQQLQVTQTELENIKDIEYASTSNSLKPLLSAKEAVTLWVLGARKAMYKQILEAKNKKVDPEITLQFLKSAIYYFLTDKENNQGHLRAIQSILGFTPKEVQNIEKARTT
ncbi:PREDICTED: myosin-11 isoform X2 [Nicrophorus vespilloides]|nr:PREDICTED: myosin-11 isoform X2 [Nicrophorus vespilloides]